MARKYPKVMADPALTQNDGPNWFLIIGGLALIGAAVLYWWKQREEDE